MLTKSNALDLLDTSERRGLLALLLDYFLVREMGNSLTHNPAPEQHNEQRGEKRCREEFEDQESEKDRIEEENLSTPKR